MPSIATVARQAAGGRADRRPRDAGEPAVPRPRRPGWAAEQGISQFIDLGCGMPTTPNTHQSAQAVNPERARRLRRHRRGGPRAPARARRAGQPGRDRDRRRRPRGRRHPRRDQPRHRPLPAGVPADGGAAALLPGRRRPRPGRRATLPALAPGSYVVLSVGRADGDEESRGFGTYSSTGAATGVQPLGGRVRRLLRPADAGAAGRGRCPRMAAGRRASRPRCRPARASRSSASPASIKRQNPIRPIERTVGFASHRSQIGGQLRQTHSSSRTVRALRIQPQVTALSSAIT